jgi:hypothetical protein
MHAFGMSRRTEHAVARLIFNIMHFRPCESKSIGCGAVVPLAIKLTFDDDPVPNRKIGNFSTKKLAEAQGL